MLPLCSLRVFLGGIKNQIKANAYCPPLKIIHPRPPLFVYNQYLPFIKTTQLPDYPVKSYLVQTMFKLVILKASLSDSLLLSQIPTSYILLKLEEIIASTSRNFSDIILPVKKCHSQTS
jgi:hypothetical protein